MRHVTCAVVGYGAIAEFHATALSENGARLVAVVGPNREAASEFAKRHNIAQVYGELEAALEIPGLDAVVLASPSWAHASQAMVALDADKHVLCEVPVALSLSEAEALARAARGKGLVAAACHTQRYLPTIVEMQARIDRERLTVRHVVARWTFRRHEHVGWTGRRRSWVDNLLWHHGGHVVDTSLLLLGMPVSCAAGGFGPPFAIDERLMDLGIVMQAPAGGVATLALSYNSSTTTNDYLVIAEEVTYLISDGKLYHAGSVIIDDTNDAAFASAVRSQDSEFLSAVSTGAACRATIDSVLPTMRVLQTVQDQLGQAWGRLHVDPSA